MANAFLFADNAQTTLAAAIGTTATTLTVAGGAGALFPSPAANQQFAITLNDALTGLVYEVCYCTARSGDVLTIVRGQEGTVAATWQIGDEIWCGPTAGQMAAMVQIPHMTDASISPVFGPTIVEGVGSGAGALQVIDRSNTGGGAGIQMLGNGATAPNKFIRVFGGIFQIVNSAYTSAIATLDDIGNWTVATDLWAKAGHFSGAIAAAAGFFVGEITAASAAIAGQITAASASISGAVFAGSLTSPSAGIGQIFSTYMNAEGAQLLLLSNSGTSSVNASNSAFVEHFCGAASQQQAAVILNQFIFSISGNGFIGIPTNTGHDFYLQWGGVGLPGDSADHIYNLPLAFPNATLAIVGNYEAQFPPLTGNCGFQPRDRATFTAVNMAPGGNNGTTFFAVGY